LKIDLVAMVEEQEEVSALVRCIRQPVQIVVRNVKFHLSLGKASQYIAEIAIKSIKSSKRLVFFLF